MANVIIDQAALLHNFQVVQALASTAKLVAVLKADAYGHGLLKVAQLLKAADVIAVARLDEALMLRQSGVSSRLLVLSGHEDAASLALFSNYQIDSVLHHRSQLDALQAARLKQPIRIWLKINTGMNRLGVAPTDASVIAEALATCPQVQQPVIWMSHLANAENRQHPLNQKQRQCFSDTVPEGVPRSLLNSAGVLHYPADRFDWVRVGLMLYGVSPVIDQTTASLGLRPAMSLQARLIDQKPLQAGDVVGYGSIWEASEPTVMGVVNIGYGDGLPREYKPGWVCMVHGVPCPVIGRVSMDLLTLDLKPLMNANVTSKVGDMVELWGKSLSVSSVADMLNTIPYTLLSRLTPRVTHTYI